MREARLFQETELRARPHGLVYGRGPAAHSSAPGQEVVAPGRDPDPLLLLRRPGSISRG